MVADQCRQIQSPIPQHISLGQNHGTTHRRLVAAYCSRRPHFSRTRCLDAHGTGVIESNGSSVCEICPLHGKIIPGRNHSFPNGRPMDAILGASRIGGRTSLLLFVACPLADPLFDTRFVCLVVHHDVSLHD